MGYFCRLWCGGMSVDLPGGRHAKVSLSVDESTRVLSGASIRLIDCSVCCTVVVHAVASVGEVPAASHQQSVQHESVSARRSGGAPGGAALTSIILGASASAWLPHPPSTRANATCAPRSTTRPPTSVSSSVSEAVRGLYRNGPLQHE